MIRKVFLVTALFVLATSYSAVLVKTQTRAPAGAVLYEAARFIPGDGSQPITNGAMLVENGTITKIGPKGSVDVPRDAVRVDLGDKTVMPALINTHGHPGFQRGITYSADNFTRDTIMEDMNRALYFGIAAVQSQGIEKGEVMYQIRADQEAGKLVHHLSLFDSLRLYGCNSEIERAVHVFHDRVAREIVRAIGDAALEARMTVCVDERRHDGFIAKIDA